MPILEELFLENEEKIFEEAAGISEKKKTIFSSSISIPASCSIKPLCRHCEWQSNLFFTSDKKKEISQKDFLKKGRQIDKMGIKRIIIPTGWQGEELPPFFYQYIQELILNLPKSEIWCAFGTINKNSLKNLKELGVSGYSCGIETTNKAIFQKMRPGDNYQKRINTIKIAKELGMKTETSLVIGVGEEKEDIVNGIYLMEEMDVDYAALWPFCPCPFTQMEKKDIPNSFFVSKILSIMVIYLKGKDIIGDTRPKNLKWFIRAGANVFGVSKKEDCKKISEMRKHYIDRILKGKQRVNKK